MIVQKLREIQHRCGWLPERELRELSATTETPLHRIHEVASFFPHYRLHEGPKVHVAVCRDMACHLRGARRWSRPWAGSRPRSAASEVQVDRRLVPGPVRQPAGPGDQRRLLLGDLRLGGAVADPGGPGQEPIRQQRADRSPLGWRIDIYDGQPRYEAVRFLATNVEGGPSPKHRRDQVIEALKVSNLRGMGGPGSRPTEVGQRPVAARARRSTSSATPTRASRAPSRTASCSAGRPTCSSRG